MKRTRPYIPLSARVLVARRQVAALGCVGAKQIIERLRDDPSGRHLRELLAILFPDERPHLDHDPALSLRRYNPRVRDPAARYSPNANDPDALVYRGQHAHHIKTNVRGDGAQRSDTGARVHERRIERNKAKRARNKNRNKSLAVTSSFDRPCWRCGFVHVNGCGARPLKRGVRIRPKASIPSRADPWPFRPFRR